MRRLTETRTGEAQGLGGRLGARSAIGAVCALATLVSGCATTASQDAWSPIVDSNGAANQTRYA